MMTADYEGVLRTAAREPHKLGWLMGKDKLLPLHSEWVRYCWDSDGPRALQAFRGGYKTTAVGVVGAVRWMLFHPDDRIAVIRKNYQAAADVVRTIADAMDREEIKALFQGVYGVIPKAKTRKEGSLAYSFKTANTPEGSITALGLESGITGSHFDKILCDDIITIKDRVSPAERRRTAGMVRELAANIIDPGKGSIWIGTPWHREDAWKVINTFCDIAKYPISRYNFLCDDAVKQKREHTTPYLYAANYELELLSDKSLLFQNPKWGVFDPDSYKHVRVYGHLDAAYGGTDACALTFIAGNNIAGFLYPGNVKDWQGFIKKKYGWYHCSLLFLETNADKGYLARDLRSLGMNISSYHESMNKALKIGTFLYERWKDLLWDVDSDPRYMEQILDWIPDGTGNDDSPDSAGSLLRQVKKTTLLAPGALAFMRNSR